MRKFILFFTLVIITTPALAQQTPLKMRYPAGSSQSMTLNKRFELNESSIKPFGVEICYQ